MRKITLGIHKGKEDAQYLLGIYSSRHYFIYAKEYLEEWSTDQDEYKEEIFLNALKIAQYKICKDL